MKPELLNNILGKIKTYFLLPEDATATEADQKLTEAIETKKPELVTGFASQIAELVQAESAKQVKEFAAQLKAESEELVSGFQSKITEFETKLSEIKSADKSTEIESLKNDIANLKGEFGNQLNELKTGKEAQVQGDGNIVEVHTEVKKAPPVKIFGQRAKA